jgi:Na+/H+ antiporter NhaC
MSGNNNLLSLFYGLIAILYIIYAGITLPLTFSYFFHRNHKMILLLIGTLYLGICLVYLNADGGKHESNEAHNSHESQLEKMYNNLLNVKSLITLIFLLVIIYSWVIAFKKVNSNSNTNTKKLF